MTEKMVWHGADALRAVLRPVGELSTHPGNPRKGDLDEIAAALNRFGQQRAVVTDPDGVILAGNHRYLAAVEKLGWTHIAAIRNDLDPAEARAYLLGDNRTSDLGEYDRAELIASIEVIEAQGSWEGTGYTEDDLSYLRSLEQAASAPLPDPVPAPESAGPMPPPELREVVLLFVEEQQHEFAENVRTLRARYKLDGVTDTVLRAIHDEALLANQGEAA